MNEKPNGGTVNDDPAHRNQRHGLASARAALPSRRRASREISYAVARVRLGAKRHAGLVLALLLGAVIGTIMIIAFTAPHKETANPAPAPVPAPEQGAPRRRPEPNPPVPAPAPADNDHPALVHQVEPGESLAQLALRYDVPFPQIAGDSGITEPDRIRPGQSLVINPRPPSVVVIEPGTTLGEYALRFGLSIAELLALNPQITDPDQIEAGSDLRGPS